MQTRFAANATDQRAKTRQLKELAHVEARPQRPDDGLLDAVPERDLDITTLPAELQRALYDAFHLELHYQPAADELVLRVTLSADTVPALSDAVERVTDAGAQGPGTKTTNSGDAPPGGTRQTSTGVCPELCGRRPAQWMVMRSG